MQRFKSNYQRFHTKDFHKFQALRTKTTCPLPDEESEANRLYALQLTALMDSDVNDPIFDRFASLAMRVFDVPMVMITLVDVDRVFRKANIGTLGDSAASSYPRETSFDAYVILPDESDVFVVEDTHNDRRFQQSPLVVSSPHVRFYAAAVLISDEQKVGTLSLMDTTPRQFSVKDQMNLLDLGVTVSGLIKERRNMNHNVSKISADLIKHTLVSFQQPIAKFMSTIAKIPPSTTDSTGATGHNKNSNGNNVLIKTTSVVAARSLLTVGMGQFRLAMEVCNHPPHTQLPIPILFQRLSNLTAPPLLSILFTLSTTVR